MDEQCCSAMTQVLVESDGPFDYPLWIDRDNNLRSNRLAVHTYKLTATGKTIAKKGRMSIFLTYCPFCGKKQDDIDV